MTSHSMKSCPMTSYLNLVPRYLTAHKRKTRLAILSVAISVALVTGVFSMLDALLRFEKLQVIHDVGNYHIFINDPDAGEMAAIGSRIDVQNAGGFKSLGEGSINGVPCQLGALDQNFAGNMGLKIIRGKYPEGKNEIMLEEWAAERLPQKINLNDTVHISFTGGMERDFVVKGIYNDFGNMKAKGVPGIFLSFKGADEIMPGKTGFYMVEFKNRVNIIKAEKDIKSTLNITDKRVGHNDRLLTLMGQSTTNSSRGLYDVGFILFCMVLVAGVIMIYNTFNISVMERVRQFGLLRCIGASRSQIKKLVKREGLTITIKAIPLGLLVGMLMTLACSAILKYYNNRLFGEIPIFTFSLIGIGAGIIIGFMTVFIAVFLPAKKASQVSPVNAVTGSNELKTSRTQKEGFLTRIFPVDVAMGINNAVLKKKTLFLMSCSIAVSITVFLGFNVLINFMYSNLKTTKPYTPDISIKAQKAEQGLPGDLYAKLSGMEGVKRVYGRMTGHVEAVFNAARLTDTYKKMMKDMMSKDIQVKENGLFAPPEKSWLISYDKNQFKWAREDLAEGELFGDKLDEQRGVIAVAANIRKGISTETAKLQV